MKRILAATNYYKHACLTITDLNSNYILKDKSLYNLL